VRAAALCCALALATLAASRTQVEQRVRLVARTLADSPAAQRIRTSGNGAAISHFDESRLHQSLAEEALARGDLATARKAADEALMHLGMARRLVPDAPARQAAARRRHEQWLATLERLLESWQARIEPSAARESAFLDAASVVGMARSLGEQSRYEESLQQLDKAERRILEGLTRLHASREADYTVRPQTPAEQWSQEQARHAELAELVPIAVRDLQPPAQAQALIERYRQTAQTLHSQAAKRSEEGDHASALALIRNAAVYLERALAAAGVLTPAPAEGSNP
jgi:hypothetical protein